MLYCHLSREAAIRIDYVGDSEHGSAIDSIDSDIMDTPAAVTDIGGNQLRHCTMDFRVVWFQQAFQTGFSAAFIGPDCRNVIRNSAVLRHHPVCK